MKDFLLTVGAFLVASFGMFYIFNTTLETIDSNELELRVDTLEISVQAIDSTLREYGSIQNRNSRSIWALDNEIEILGDSLDAVSEDIDDIEDKTDILDGATIFSPYDSLNQ